MAQTRDEIRRFLDQNYVIGMVTLEEHNRLKPFSCKMPTGWRPATDLFARYRRVAPEILVEDKSGALL